MEQEQQESINNENQLNKSIGVIEEKLENINDEDEGEDECKAKDGFTLEEVEIMARDLLHEFARYIKQTSPTKDTEIRSIKIGKDAKLVPCPPNHIDDTDFQIILNQLIKTKNYDSFFAGQIRQFIERVVDRHDKIASKQGSTTLAEKYGISSIKKEVPIEALPKKFSSYIKNLIPKKKNPEQDAPPEIPQDPEKRELGTKVANTAKQHKDLILTILSGLTAGALIIQGSREIKYYLKKLEYHPIFSRGLSPDLLEKMKEKNYFIELRDQYLPQIQIARSQKESLNPNNPRSNYAFTKEEIYKSPLPESIKPLILHLCLSQKEGYSLENYPKAITQANKIIAELQENIYWKQILQPKLGLHDDELSPLVIMAMCGKQNHIKHVFEMLVENETEQQEALKCAKTGVFGFATYFEKYAKNKQLQNLNKKSADNQEKPFTEQDANLTTELLSLQCLQLLINEKDSDLNDPNLYRGVRISTGEAALCTGLPVFAAINLYTAKSKNKFSRRAALKTASIAGLAAALSGSLDNAIGSIHLNGGFINNPEFAPLDPNNECMKTLWKLAQSTDQKTLFPAADKMIKLNLPPERDSHQYYQILINEAEKEIQRIKEEIKDRKEKIWPKLNTPEEKTTFKAKINSFQITIAIFQEIINFFQENKLSHPKATAPSQNRNHLPIKQPHPSPLIDTCPPNTSERPILGRPGFTSAKQKPRKKNVKNSVWDSFN